MTVRNWSDVGSWQRMRRECLGSWVTSQLLKAALLCTSQRFSYLFVFVTSPKVESMRVATFGHTKLIFDWASTLTTLGFPEGQSFLNLYGEKIANRCKRSCSMGGVSHKKKNRHPTKSPSNDHVYLCLDNISLFSCSFVEATLSCMQSSFVLKNT